MYFLITTYMYVLFDHNLYTCTFWSQVICMWSYAALRVYMVSLPLCFFSARVGLQPFWHISIVRGKVWHILKWFHHKKFSNEIHDITTENPNSSLCLHMISLFLKGNLSQQTTLFRSYIIYLFIENLGPFVACSETFSQTTWTGKYMVLY